VIIINCNDSDDKRGRDKGKGGRRRSAAGYLRKRLQVEGGSERGIGKARQV
jgi:hypothetical protein